MRNSIFALAALTCSAILSGCGSDPEPTEKPDIKGVRPIVFVHGLAGSGDQFQAQAMRFASNGYPENFYYGFDHNSLLELDRQENLDAFIDRVRDETGFDQVVLVGHSMGTSISQDYLEQEEHALKIAHYINVDGLSADALPGGVPTLNIAATGFAGSMIEGGVNVEFTDQTHVQAVSSPETFEHMYEFITGDEPTTTDILPSTDNTIQLKGRFVEFIANNVPENTILSIYEVDPATGHRINYFVPDFQQAIGDDGEFNFTNAKQGAAYEFHVARPGVQDEEGHYYYEPFVRNDTMIRIKYSEPGELLYNVFERSDESTALLILRNREMQGVEIGDIGVDSIKVNGTELCDGILPGGTGVNSSGPIALLVYDVNSDQISDVDNLAGISWDSIFDNVMPFVNVVDHYMPADVNASGSHGITMTDRVTHRVQSINVPRWSSVPHTTMVQFIPQ